MKTPLEILRIKAPDGTLEFKAIISLQDAIADTSQSKRLILLQDAYAKYAAKSKELWLKVKSSKKNQSDSQLQWKLADFLLTFSKYAENEGYVVTNIAEAISRDVGISKSQLNYLRKFRLRYPTIDLVSGKINWSKYREVMDIGSSDIRKNCEKLIIEGKLKTDFDIREFKRSHKI